MALNVVRNSRLVACEDPPDVFTRFLSWSCRIASCASSSFISGPNECCMLSVTLERVVGLLHASQAAPAVAFNAKTVSFLASTMTVDPSGSLFTTKVSKLVRSTCIWCPLSWSVSKGFVRLSLSMHTLICTSLAKNKNVQNLAFRNILSMRMSRILHEKWKCRFFSSTLIQSCLALFKCSMQFITAHNEVEG
jgi:hypothetical protein